MKTRMAIGLGAVSTLALLVVMAPGVARSHDEHSHGGMESAAGHSHEKCELHGGSVTMTPANHFEVLFSKSEIRTYVYDGKQVPVLNPERATASVVLLSKQGKSTTEAMKYVAPDTSKGRIQGYFVALHDFAGYVPGSMKAGFHIEGISTKPVDFKTPVEITEPARYICPMHADQTAEDPMNCPECGMAMKKVGGTSEHKHAH